MSARAEVAAPPSGGLLRNLLLLILSCGFALGFCEAALRLAGYRAIYEVYSKPSALWVHDPDLGWVHPPGSRGDFVGPRPWPIEFRTSISINSLGLRGPEVSPLPPGGKRVLVLGDSMVAAFEVPYEETFTALLQTSLTERLGAQVQVVNAGVRGYGTDQSYLYFRERGRALAPDLVVFFHSGNDLTDNVKLHEMRRPLGKPAFALQAGASLELLGHPVPSYPACSEVRIAPGDGAVRVDGSLSRVFCMAQMALFDHSALFSFVTLLVPWDQGVMLKLYRLGAPAKQAGADTPDAAVAYETELTLALLDQLARAVEADGARFLMIGVGRQIAALGRERLAERRIAVHDLDPLDGATNVEVRWQHDGHYNPKGHRLVAEQLAPELEALLRR